MPLTPTRDSGPTSFHGRRRGRRLRPGRQHLLQDRLPGLRIIPPAGGDTLDPRRMFEAPVRDVWLEVGFGAGEHLTALASAHPDVGFVGCEPFMNGVAALLSQVERLGLKSVRVFDDDARLLLPHLAPASIARVFVLFPDPWPKARHAGRRFIGPPTLDLLAHIMADDAELRVASDHPVMVRWALFHALQHPEFTWPARRCRDWRTPPADDAPTRYEAKAASRNVQSVYLQFRRKRRTHPPTSAEQVPCAQASRPYICDVRLD